MGKCWQDHLQRLSTCTQCTELLPKLSVVCPPGLIYPDPPDPVRVLFVGVAPPRPGDHFYSQGRDRLRDGLFSVLEALDYPCQSLRDFHELGFFLTHTAKCPLEGTWKPSLVVSKKCASRHLAEEIRILSPSAVCFLSGTIGLSVLNTVLLDPQAEELPLGEVGKLSVGASPSHFLVTKWPGRGWQAETRRDLGRLLSEAAIQ